MRVDRTLHVLFRLGQYPALSETFIIQQMRGLLKRGHRVSVLADSSGPSWGDQGLSERLSGLTSVHYLRPTAKPFGALYDRLPYRLRRMHAAAAERLLAQRVDIVLCHFGWCGLSVANSFAGRRRSARLVTVLHGDDMSRAISHGGDAVYDTLFREADLLLPVSEHWRRRLRDLGAPPEKILVHHMGVDLARHRFVERQRSPAEPVRLVSVGRLVEKKGTELALRALALLRSRNGGDLPIRYDVYGSGPLRTFLETLAEELALSGIVRFCGPRPHAEVLAAMEKADIFVLPSRTAEDGDMEGIPVVLMEAMASGAPVVTTKHSGIPELVVDGVTGFVARENDVEALADALQSALEGEPRRRSLARAAREKVQRAFNVETLDDRLDAILQDLAAGPGEERLPFGSTVSPGSAPAPSR